MTRRSVLRSSLVLAAAGIRVAGQRCERGTQPPGAAPNPLGLTASVQPSPDPRCRLVLAHPERPFGGLDLVVADAFGVEMSRYRPGLHRRCLCQSVD